jgi:hypothetical protein
MEIIQKTCFSFPLSTPGLQMEEFPMNDFVKEEFDKLVLILLIGLFSCLLVFFVKIGMLDMVSFFKEQTTLLIGTLLGFLTGRIRSGSQQ